jgi:hypothetical protein
MLPPPKSVINLDEETIIWLEAKEELIDKHQFGHAVDCEDFKI